MKISFLSMSFILMSASSVYCMERGNSYVSQYRSFDGSEAGAIHPETIVNDIAYARARLLESFDGQSLNGISLVDAFEDCFKNVKSDLMNQVYWQQLNNFFLDVIHGLDKGSIWMCSNGSKPVIRLQRCISIIVQQFLKLNVEGRDEMFMMDEDLEDFSDGCSENEELVKSEIKTSQKAYEEQENRVNMLRAFNSSDPHLEHYARRIYKGTQF